MKLSQKSIADKTEVEQAVWTHLPVQPCWHESCLDFFRSDSARAAGQTPRNLL